MSTWDIVLICLIIWAVTKFASLYMKAKNEILQEEIADLTQKLKNKIIHVNVEQYGSVFYLFEKDTNRFIAQGVDISEIKKTCEARFKDAVIVADSDELKKYGLE
jgi:calcineurin-like phosphoesterase